MGELEESITEQMKIPAIQLLQTEYARLREKEDKVVSALIEQKKKRANSRGGGPMFKADPVGLELRKKVNGLRVKLKVIAKKLRRYGRIGKIPMGAWTRIYYENSEDDDSSASSETESESQDGDSDATSPKRNKRKKGYDHEQVLLTELTY